MKKEYIKYGIVIGAFFMTLFLFNQCNAQVFTQQSKAVNVGTFTNNGEQTITFNLTTDNNFHISQSGVQLFSYGDNFAYINQGSYTLVWVTTYQNNLHQTVEAKDNFDISGTYGYAVIANKKPHKITLTRNATTKKLLIDSILIGTVTTQPQSAFTAAFWLGSDRADMKLSGTVTGFQFTPDYVSSISYPQPAGVLDSIEYPLGWNGTYNNVADPITQYATYPRPMWFPKSITEANSLCVELKYMAGYKSGAGENTALITANGKSLMTTLATYYNCGIRICSNINSFYSDWSRGDYCFDCQMMQVAQQFPKVRKDFGSAMVQTSTTQRVELDQATADSPIEYFKPIRDMALLQGQALKDALALYSIPDTGLFMFEDKEGLRNFNNTQQFVDRYNYMLDPMKSLFSSLKSTTYDTYSYWWESTATIFPQNLIGNVPKSSMSRYIIHPSLWNSIGGSYNGTPNNGIQRIMKSVYDEIQKGYTHQTPFVSPGWNADITKNLPHGQWSGLLGIQVVLGADFFFPAYFTITGTGIQNEKGYCDIPAIPAFIQASVSNPKFQNLLKNGTLLPGTAAGLGGTNQWDYNLWVGSDSVEGREILSVAKKLGTEYIIATTHQRGNPYKYTNKRKLKIAPVIDGDTIPFMFTREQATLWYLDKSKPCAAGVNPKMISSQCKVGHLSRQSTPAAMSDEGN